MANEKELTKLYKIRNGYTVIKGNTALKEGNVALTNKEYNLQSWKVEAILTEDFHSKTEDVIAEEAKDIKEQEEPNIDRSIKKSKFNRVMKTQKE